MIDLGSRASANASAESEPEAERSGVFKRLRESLAKSRQALTEEISASLFDRIDDETWELLEEALILADAGASTTAAVVERLEHEVEAGTVAADGVAVRDRLIEILAEVAGTGRAPIDLSAEPAVLMMVGVNGTGKTTTIGKIAWHLSKEFGLSVVLAAGDTYRAAAAEQLAEWAQRAGVDLVRGEEGADPGSVAFDAISAAQARGADVVIVDTAGRLHTQDNLMEELAKVRRVIGKLIPDAPHETLISIDSTTGQNGLRREVDLGAGGRGDLGEDLDQSIADRLALGGDRSGVDFVLESFDHRGGGRRADVGEDQRLLQEFPGFVVDFVEDGGADLLLQGLAGFREALAQATEDAATALRLSLLGRRDVRGLARTEVDHLLPTRRHRPGRLAAARLAWRRRSARRPRTRDARRAARLREPNPGRRGGRS